MTALIPWLKLILDERYGYKFDFSFTASNDYSISVQGSTKTIVILSDMNTFSRNDSSLPCGSWDSSIEGWDGAIDNVMPTPGLESVTGRLIESVDNGFIIKYDILGLVYWMLCRVEEIDRKELDRFGRFLANESHAYKYGYLDRPIVDEWLFVLRQVIVKTWPNLTLKNNIFNVKLSHDVDIPSRYAFKKVFGFFRSVLGDLRRRDFSSLINACRVRFCSEERLHPKDAANTFDWIMGVSEAHGLQSVFYFICGRTDIKKDADYEIEHPAIRNLLREMYLRGHEIGLHPSFNSVNNLDVISAEFKRLRMVCVEEKIAQEKWGSRMHYLRWSPTNILDLNRAGVDYDSTLTYADHAGFRCGTCFEYNGFDVKKGEILNVRIRPLIVMENTIFDSGYMNLGLSKNALKVLGNLKDACRKVGGSFTLLWHNTSLMTSEQRAFYKAVLDL